MRNPQKAIGQALVDVAPSISNALRPGTGGLAVGSALQALVPVLDLKPDAKPEEIQEVLSRGLTPDQLVELQEVDKKFAFAWRRVHADQLVNARRMQTRLRSRTVCFLSCMIVGAFVLAVAGVFCLAMRDSGGQMDPTVVAFLGGVIGYLSAKADTVVAFYFGSSSGQETQHEAFNDTMRDMRGGGK